MSIKIEAKKLTDIGLVCVPLMVGKKAPAVKAWETLTKTPLASFKPTTKGFGIVCGGASGVFCLDIDNVDMWRKVLQAAGNPTEHESTPAVQTPSGGFHFYFQHDPEITTTTNAMEIVGGDKTNIDIRAAKGQVVAPPSVYYASKKEKKQYEGKLYEWIRSFDDCKPQQCPSWLKRLILKTDKLTKEGDALRVVSQVTERPDNLESDGELGSILAKVKKQETALVKNLEVSVDEPDTTTDSDAVNWDTIGEIDEAGGYSQSGKTKTLTLEQITRIVNGLKTDRFSDYDNWCHLLWAVARWQEANEIDEDTVTDMLDEFSQKCSGYGSKSDVVKKYNEAFKGKNKQKKFTVGTVIHWWKEDNPNTPSVLAEPSIFPAEHDFFYPDFQELANRSEANVADVKQYLSRATCRILNSGKHFFLTKNRETFDGSDRIMSTYSEVQRLFAGSKLCDKVLVKEYDNPDFDAERKPGPANMPKLQLTIGGTLDSILNDKKEYPTYDRVVFKPYSIVDKTPARDFNLFRGFPWKQRPTWNVENIETIRKHFIEVYANGNEAHGSYLMSLEAWRVQFPDTKSRVAIVLQSRGQQAGFKSGYYCNALQYLVGPAHHLIIDKVEDLGDKFNTIRKGRLAVVLEEISNWGGAHKSNDLIKNLLTSNKIRIEPKGIDSYVIDDFSNYVFLTQHDFPVKIESQDVRIAMFQCSDKYAGKSDYFKKLGAALGVNKKGELTNPDSIQDWYSYLMSLDLSDFDPQKIPETESRNAVKERCVDPIVQYVIDVWNNGGDKIYHDSYKAFIKENNIRADSHTSKSFNTAFKNLMNPTAGTVQFRVGGNRPTGFIVTKDEGLELVRKHLKNPAWEYEQPQIIHDDDAEYELDEAF